MERRLAAILAADVVGYSRLMGEDAEENATTPWRNEPIRAGLALALTDVQHHPQCPLWVKSRHPAP